MDEIVIERADPRAAPAAALIAELDAYLRGLYPPASNHLLDAEALGGPDVRFFLARVRELVVGCAALRLDPAGYAEIKRMYVRVPARGIGAGRVLLRRLETEAAESGVTLLRLETGIHQPEARALYEAAGYVECGPFGNYPEDPLSIFMEKRLPSQPPAGPSRA
jgi:putative acetyltransferase